MLTRAQIDEYNEVGAIVLPGVLTQQEVARLRAVTDSFVARARGMTGHDDVLDLDETHTPDAPRVRRIKRPHLRHPEYAAYWRHPGIIAALTDLWGPNIRSDTSKLNMKLAGHGAAVEWHQDWVFYPHTNDDLAEVGIMIDAATTGNGPMLVVPGSHKGPLFSHHVNGRFCGAMDPHEPGAHYERAVPLTGPAGSITIHHARVIHGSGPNRSDTDRRFMLLQFRAADAWPLAWAQPDGAADIEAFNAMIVAGEPVMTPRIEKVPLYIPWPRAERQGSIYENQKAMAARYF